MRKSYSIDQSPLYKIKGLNQLESRLNVQLSKLPKLLKPEGYRVWLNENKREIQAPLGWLGDVHKNLAKLLAKIEMPDYVFSKAKRSYIDNAYEHVGFHSVAKTDISKYYPSTTRDMVKKMFIEKFKCARDVSEILSDICCYQQKMLPTGSPISGYVAFFANKQLFDAVHTYAKRKGCTFTLYVDDLTISGNAVSKKLINEVRLMVKHHGLLAKRSKTKIYTSHVAKEVTGTAILGNRLTLPKRRHKAIFDARMALKAATNPLEIQKLSKSLKGKQQEARQIKKINDGKKLYETINTPLVYS